MSNKTKILNTIQHNIIISVQAMPDEPLYNEVCMEALMQSVINGGASALRVAGARDVKIAKKISDIPVIGITKPSKIPDNYKDVVYITRTLKEVKEIIDAGADIIAFDATTRDRGTQENLYQMIEFIKLNGKLAMADISNFSEGITNALLGVDIISTTLSGYTSYTDSHSEKPDFDLVRKLSNVTNIPIILEGRIWEPNDVKKAFKSGAFSVVIGSAVTRPQLITKRFIQAS